jgi:periplasmic divalent cation tolerance protein
MQSLRYISSRSWEGVYGEQRMNSYVQVTTTTPTSEDAARIADALIERRLAACVQVIDTIDSTYWWQGKIERATEWLLIAKTERRLYAEVEASIREAHPYEIPEVLALEVIAGSDGYLRWLSGELRRDDA